MTLGASRRRQNSYPVKVSPGVPLSPAEPSQYLGLGEKFSTFIIVSMQAFTQRNLDRFGATWLLNHAKSVHLVDLSLLVWDKVSVSTHQDDVVRGVLKPESWEDVKSLLQQHGQGALLVPHVTPYLGMPLLKLIAEQSISTLFYDSGRTPDSRSLFRLIAARTQSAVSDPVGLMRRTVKRLTAVQVPIDYFVLSGTDCEFRPHSWSKDARLIIPSHAYDYVVWKESSPFAYSKPYIVFLDQAKADHPDFMKLLGANPFTRESYYPHIEKFLCHLSATFGMPVLVALHPRSSDAGCPRSYQGFQTYRGRTASLVKGSSLVVSHDSTAISFAVLGRKPLILADFDEKRRRLHIGNIRRNVSAQLGVPVVHINSRTLPKAERLTVDEAKYAAYEAMYIRHPACNGIPIWERLFASSQAVPRSAPHSPGPT
jgi:hypothetical protein